MASSERNSRTNSAASCQGLEPGSRCLWPFASRDSVAPLTPITSASSPWVTARKRAARTVARDRMTPGSGAGRVFSARAVAISVEIISLIYFHSKRAVSAGIAASRWPRRRTATSAVGSVKIPGFRGDDAVLAVLLRALQRRPAGLHQPLERQRARRHEVRDPGAQGDVAAGAGRGVVHQQIAHALRYHLGVLRRLVGGLALGEHREGSALPAADQIAAAAVGAADDPRHTADAGIARRAIEFFVIGPEIVDVEERQADLVRIPLREHPVPLQQLLEVFARVQPREAVLAQPGGEPR